jgi:adenine phosphoribosyltransferase
VGDRSGGSPPALTDDLDYPAVNNRLGGDPAALAALREKIRDVPNFPKEGILFKDITTLLKDPLAFRQVVDMLADTYRDKTVELVVGVESRGFIFGGALAYQLHAGFVPVRKEGKLPARKISESYALEYGSAVLEIHKDAIEPGQKVVIVDDLLATGGTARATARLVQQLGGQVVGISFLVELKFLKGVEHLREYDVVSHLQF